MGRFRAVETSTPVIARIGILVVSRWFVIDIMVSLTDSATPTYGFLDEAVVTRTRAPGVTDNVWATSVLQTETAMVTPDSSSNVRRMVNSIRCDCTMHSPSRQRTTKSDVVVAT